MFPDHLLCGLGTRLDYSLNVTRYKASYGASLDCFAEDNITATLMGGEGVRTVILSLIRNTMLALLELPCLASL